MRAGVVEISWHDSSPIWSIDVSAANRVVTAGGDKVARIWRITSNMKQLNATDKPAVSSNPKVFSTGLIDWLADLRAHSTNVNIVRFSVSGAYIASGADQGEVIIWGLNGTEEPLSAFQAAQYSSDESLHPRERWTVHATLRGHLQDVLDLAWSADGRTLVSGSVDNSIMIWDIRNPTNPPVALRSHSNFVQGVSLDPVSRIIASLGNDRTLRVFSRMGNAQWAQVAAASALTSETKLFAGDMRTKTFFRRLAWSPDGSVLACPSGLDFRPEGKSFAVHIFARNHWLQPAAQCGGLTKSACAVRFSPVLYALRNPNLMNPGVETPLTESNQPNTQLEGDENLRMEIDEQSKSTKSSPFNIFPYRMILAVACTDSVLFYDTESFSRPFAKVTGLHCAEHTDISWTEDGLNLLVSSVDGYSSIISFSSEELGVKLTEELTPRWLREYNLQKQQRIANCENTALAAHVGSGLGKGPSVTVVAPKSAAVKRPAARNSSMIARRIVPQKIENAHASVRQVQGQKPLAINNNQPEDLHVETTSELRTNAGMQNNIIDLT